MPGIAGRTRFPSRIPSSWVNGIRQKMDGPVPITSPPDPSGWSGGSAPSTQTMHGAPPCTVVRSRARAARCVVPSGVRSAESRLTPASHSPRDGFPGATERTPPGSPRTPDTSARSATRLASTSRLGSDHRCPHTSFAGPLASRLDLVPGTFETIDFPDLRGSDALESADLVPERGLSRHPSGAFAAGQRLQLFAPPRQQPPTDAEFLRERDDVLARIQPSHGHVPDRLRKPCHALHHHLQRPCRARDHWLCLTL